MRRNGDWMALNGHWMVTEMYLPFSRLNGDWRWLNGAFQFSRNGGVSSCASYAEWGYSRSFLEMSSKYLLTRRVEKTTSIQKQILYRMRVQKPRIFTYANIEGVLRGPIPVKCSCIHLLSKNSIFPLFQIAPFLWINQEINPNGFEIYFEIICNFLPPLRGDQRANRANQMDELIYMVLKLKIGAPLGSSTNHQKSNYKVVSYHTLHTRSYSKRFEGYVWNVQNDRF